jgi:hypothetical protein
MEYGRLCPRCSDLDKMRVPDPVNIGEGWAKLDSMADQRFKDELAANKKS